IAEAKATSVTTPPSATGCARSATTSAVTTQVLKAASDTRRQLRRQGSFNLNADAAHNLDAHNERLRHGYHDPEYDEESGGGDIHSFVLDESAPLQDSTDADTAIFYSISNAQKGLAGISFGGFLIKRVVDSLTAEFKGLKTFATLSPAPGFTAWLESALAGEAGATLSAADADAFASLDLSPADPARFVAGLRSGDWAKSAQAETLKEPLFRLAARYLAREKAGEKGEAMRALDPVAHFHLTNGARLERLNWLADASPRGFRQSAGIMVNYLYRLADIEENHEAYSDRGEVRVSPAVRGLLKA
ncbi:MAG: malonyl-CoA decarboxylase family protein, partial [Pseudomonadota bacterium]